MAAYYNEIDPYCAEWLRNLMAAGQIASGEVDTRPIQDVMPGDLKGFSQCHFFAGLGGWSIALKLAGVPDDAPIWTGSPPCQPFSTAGKQKGKNDERHLWPEFYRLIRAGKPETVYGEQVAAAITHEWWDDVADDLEREGYTTGAAVLPACSVGAPHKRDRLWFVAHTQGYNDRGVTRRLPESYEQQAQQGQGGARNAQSSSASIMGNAKYNGLPAAAQYGGDGQAIQHHAQGQDGTSEPEGTSASSDVAHAELRRRKCESLIRCGKLQLPLDAACETQQSTGACSAINAPSGDVADTNNQALERRDCGISQERPRKFPAWQGGAWIDCPDGKHRLIEPSICLLAHGIPARASKLRAYGNAIVPQVAAQFIKANLEAIGDCQ